MSMPVMVLSCCTWCRLWQQHGNSGPGAARGRRSKSTQLQGASAGGHRQDPTKGEAEAEAETESEAGERLQESAEG